MKHFVHIQKRTRQYQAWLLLLSILQPTQFFLVAQEHQLAYAIIYW